MSEPTFRCGWKVFRPAAINLFNFAGSMVVVRRGHVRVTMPVETFNNLSDQEFVDCVERAYRNGAFDQMVQDLDVLARQLIGELEAGSGILVTGVPADDVNAALYRWQRAKRDTEEPRL